MMKKSQGQSKSKLAVAVVDANASPKSQGRAIAQPPGRIIDLPPTFCKVGGGPAVKIKLKGSQLSLAGYGYPKEGFALNYGVSLDEIPPFPEDSSSGVAVKKTLGDHPDAPGPAKWGVALNDVCTGAPQPRTVVVWYRYVNEDETDIYWLVDVTTFDLPACAAIKVACS